MSDKVLQELKDIKSLLIALLLKLGATSDEIGTVLRVDQSRIRQIVPARKVKKIQGI
jgi:DNA-directed RNA polymerase specialized sigma subunit